MPQLIFNNLLRKGCLQNVLREGKITTLESTIDFPIRSSKDKGCDLVYKYLKVTRHEFFIEDRSTEI